MTNRSISRVLQVVSALVGCLVLGVAPVAADDRAAVAMSHWVAGSNGAVAGAPPSWAPDPTFGSGGVKEAFFSTRPNDAAWASGVAIQHDGKIVVAGTLFRTPAVGGDQADFAVARFLTDGSLDPGFGQGGRVTISFGTFDEAFGLALERVGGQTKIVVVGHIYTAPGHRFGIARLSADGTLDTDHDGDPAIHMGHAGTRMVAFGNAAAFARSVAIQPDGLIVVAGILNPASRDNGNFGLARLVPRTGELDRGFGTHGRVRVDLSENDAARSIAIQPAAHGAGFRLVVGGSSAGPKGSDSTVLRLLGDGRLDLSFGIQGFVVTRLRAHGPGITGSYESFDQIVVGSNGRIVGVGSARVLDQGGFATDVPALVRYTPNGELDHGFSGDGIVRMGGAPRESYYRIGTAVALRPDGSVVWAGTRHYAAEGEATRFLVGGVKADGSRDTHFGPWGFMSVSVGPAADDAHGIALDKQGRIVIAGISDSPDGTTVGTAFGLARLALP